MKDLDSLAKECKELLQSSTVSDTPYFKVMKELKSELKDRGYSDKDVAIMIKNIEIDVDEDGYEAMNNHDLIADFAELLAESYESHKDIFPTYYREVFSNGESLTLELKSD
jgi:hypothetical protein